MVVIKKNPPFNIGDKLKKIWRVGDEVSVNLKPIIDSLIIKDGYVFNFTINNKNTIKIFESKLMILNYNTYMEYRIFRSFDVEETKFTIG